MSTHHREVNEPTAGVTRACFEASREINLLLTGTRAASQRTVAPTSIPRTPTSINTSSAVSGLIKHNWPAQFSRNNNNKQPRGLDVHDYFTQAHINTHKSPKARLLLELTESRTTMDLQPCRSWAGGNALSGWRLRRGLGCGKGFCACCSPPPRPPQKTPEQKQGSEETRCQTAIWGWSPGLSYQMSLWWMVGFKHRANDISKEFVNVGKYKTTLGSISHIS